MMNGNASAVGTTPTPEEVSQANALIAQIKPIVRNTMVVTMRGLISSFPGVRPDVIMSLLCHEVGFQIGSMLQGDLGAILQVRKACRQAYEEGMRQAPPPNAAAPPPVAAASLRQMPGQGNGGA